MKPWAPSRFSSSPSVKRKRTSRRSGGRAFKARAVSSSVATAEPSSAAPKLCGTESKWPTSITALPLLPDVPRSRATTLVIVPAEIRPAVREAVVTVCS
ncbi:MAG: hypothetical protein QM765_31620 [Myxococcales bacterium]